MPSNRARLLAAGILGSALLAAAPVRSAELPRYAREETWEETMLALRAAGITAREARALSRDLERDFPIETDWIAADAAAGGAQGPSTAEPFGWLDWFDGREGDALEVAWIERAARELGSRGKDVRDRLLSLRGERAAPADRRWLELYAEACRLRRRARLERLAERWPRIVFTKHYNLGGSHYAYTEGLSDAQAERHFVPGSSLCLLEIDGDRTSVRTLLEDPAGVIRDPDVSWDGTRILFAWKKSDREDDYHLYEMDAGTGTVRQITSGLGFADYEGVYLPSGDLLFNSTRCVQTVDCWWTEVSNLYACDPDGRCLRRISFDQVHTNYPQVLPDGRIAYTRWDYSDRGQIYPQGLFQMNPDGTGQTELYGNDSWFPTTILHARGIPGSTKLVAILTGHHTIQVGKLALIDVARGRRENQGVRLIAPERATPAERIDRYGQEGDLFQYPYPLSEEEHVVAYAPEGWTRGAPRFRIYWMAADGRRELLASDPAISSNQPVPLASRRLPRERSSIVDYRMDTGTFLLQDVFAGPGLRGVPRGSVDRIRLVAIEYRAAGIGRNYSQGPGGAALSSTPVSIGNGSWDVKVVLGDAKVHADGSACFTAPARTPLYFIALDRKGRAVQTMRSWCTLQPGEFASCVGCHESKNSAPPAGGGIPLALREGPQDLVPFQGPPRGFSFRREIQPILDRHCIRCHDRSGTGGPMEAGGRIDADAKAFSLLDRETVDPTAKRSWSDAYLALTGASTLVLSSDAQALAGRSGGIVDWIGTQSPPEPLSPYSHGAARSRIFEILGEGHGGVRLDEAELERLACWIDLLVPFCGDYREAAAWTEEERATYERFLEKRRMMERIERQGIAEFLNGR